MKIKKRGLLSKVKISKTCLHCDSIFEITIKDIDTSITGTHYDYHYFDCPVCKNRLLIKKSAFRDELKNKYGVPRYKNPPSPPPKGVYQPTNDLTTEPPKVDANKVRKSVDSSKESNLDKLIEEISNTKPETIIYIHANTLLLICNEIKSLKKLNKPLSLDKEEITICVFDGRGVYFKPINDLKSNEDFEPFP